jgi:hypothetical protein
MPIYEHIDSFHLVPGETYRVKHYDRELGLLTFNRYIDDDKIRICVINPVIYGTIPMSNIKIYIYNDNGAHSFSKLISQEEYRAKLKEKYDKNATDTVLSTLLNHIYTW